MLKISGYGYHDTSLLEILELFPSETENNDIVQNIIMQGLTNFHGIYTI